MEVQDTPNPLELLKMFEMFDCVSAGKELVRFKARQGKSFEGNPASLGVFLGSCSCWMFLCIDVSVQSSVHHPIPALSLPTS